CQHDGADDGGPSGTHKPLGTVAHQHHLVPPGLCHHSGAGEVSEPIERLPWAATGHERRHLPADLVALGGPALLLQLL
ncbi:unnamed protein product, partial [Effrenium voratum]